MEEDPETGYAYFCFCKLHWAPHQFDDLDDNEKAAVIAFIRKWLKDDREAKKKAQSK